MCSAPHVPPFQTCRTSVRPLAGVRRSGACLGRWHCSRNFKSPSSVSGLCLRWQFAHSYSYSHSTRPVPAAPVVASVTSMQRAPWLRHVARNALSISSASAYGNGERPCKVRRTSRPLHPLLAPGLLLWAHRRGQMSQERLKAASQAVCHTSVTEALTIPGKSHHAWCNMAWQFTAVLHAQVPE